MRPGRARRRLRPRVRALRRHALPASGATPVCRRMSIRYGISSERPRALASPEINFNMQSYLSRYPEKEDGPGRSPYLEWLKRGRAAARSPTLPPAWRRWPRSWGWTRRAGRPACRYPLDLQERLRTGTLGEMFARAAEVEPLIGDVWTETTRADHPAAGLAEHRRPGRRDARLPTRRPGSPVPAWSWWPPNRDGEAAGGWRGTSPMPCTGRIEPTTSS